MSQKSVNLLLLALKVDKGATSQGMWAALETGKAEEADSPLEPPESSKASNILISSPVEPILDFWATELWDNRFLSFYTTKFVAPCYSSLRIIQLQSNSFLDTSSQMKGNT